MKKIFLLIFSLILLCGTHVFAGGVIMVDDVTKTGVPAKWPRDEATKTWVMDWWSDPGRLNSKYDHDTAVQWVKDLLNTWKNVKLNLPDGSTIQTVSLQFNYKGNVNTVNGYRDIQDINVDNFHRFVPPFSPGNAAPPTVVIFDADGSIFLKKLIEETGDPEKAKARAKQLIGQGAPTVRDGSTKTILSGFIIMNGLWVDGIENDDNLEMPVEQYKASILHELGHMLNLDHSQVNIEIAEACDRGDCAQAEAIPTMFPRSQTAEQLHLHRDDKVTISWLYSHQNFLDKFCTVRGEIRDEKGKGMQGVNVIARNLADPVHDARSMVSGLLYHSSSYDNDGRVIPEENGKYILSGLVPKQDYEVIYEELSSVYNNPGKAGSGFMPLDADSPIGFGRGHVKDSVRCDKGGNTIDLDPVQISMNISPNDVPPPPENPSDKKGWCSLNRDSSPTDFGFLLLLFPLALIWTRRLVDSHKSQL